MLNSSTIKRTRLGQFFYAEEVPYAMALIRIVMPLIVLIVVSWRWARARELYSLDGAPAPLADNFGYYDVFPIFSGTVAVALFSALVILLLFSSIGWCTRFSLACSTVLFAYFNMIDYLSTINKYCVIANHVLFILTISECGAIWSVDAWLKKRAGKNYWPGQPSTAYPLVPVWPRRLLQLLIGVVYFGAAMTKFHTPAFFSGDQMIYWAMTNVNHSHRLGEYFTLYPVLFVIGGYVTIIWEIVFLFIVWSRVGRWFALAGGFAFHLGTLLLLGLYIFPAVCWTIYLSYMNEQDVQWLAAKYRRLSRRYAWLRREWIPNGISKLAQRLQSGRWYHSQLVYAFALVSLVMIGVEWEYRLDVYGIRRPEGPHPLKEITDRELINRMLRVSEPIREEDKFLAFDIGTGIISGILSNRRDTFTHGEMLFAQITLSPPHEDMWVECNLHDADGPIIDRVGNVIGRELSRVEFNFDLRESLSPGDYMVVLKSKGREITRRYFTLLPKISVTAN
ncbi:MAG: HTTM domain-containing protein [Planctomycetaceae bacterium]